jgi:endoglucanase
MIDKGSRRTHERWLKALTSIPTAAGHEGRVIGWIERWVAARRNLSIARDGGGNLFVRRRLPRGARAARPPLFITAHLDHPAFVVLGVRRRDVQLEFRGTVHDPYFNRARIEIFAGDGRRHGARIVALDAAAKPFKRITARLDKDVDVVASGDIARWAFDDRPLPHVAGGLLHTHACDDLAGAAAALCAMDVLRSRKGMGHVALLFTRAEEVGFIGAIAACRDKSVPKRSRLICLETSRSFAESPIGAGPIVRVGDRMSVFEPNLTNTIGLIMTEHEKARAGFRWQRKLMPGGTCEATAFSAFGYQSTCLCLPLGNYHNMVEIDRVTAGGRRAVVGPEFISVNDFHGLVEMLVVCATKLDSPGRPSLRRRMDELMASHGYVLGDAKVKGQRAKVKRQVKRARSKG